MNSQTQIVFFKRTFLKSYFEKAFKNKIFLIVWEWQVLGSLVYSLTFCHSSELLLDVKNSCIKALSLTLHRTVTSPSLRTINAALCSVLLTVILV